MIRCFCGDSDRKHYFLQKLKKKKSSANYMAGKKNQKIRFLQLWELVYHPALSKDCIQN